MELTLTTFDEASGAAARVVLDTPAGTSGERIDAALSKLLGHPEARWFLGDRALRELRFGEPPLVDGAVLTRVAPTSLPGESAQMHLLVLEGPASGQHRLLQRGHVSIGKDRAEFCLADDALHPVHAVLHVEAERLALEEITGATRRVEADKAFPVGGSRLVVGTGFESVGALPAAAVAEGPLPPRTVDLAAASTGWKMLLLTLALPLVLGGVLAWIFSLWMILMFALMSSVMGLVHWLTRGSAVARNRERLREACTQDLALSEAAAPSLGLRLLRAGCAGLVPAESPGGPSGKAEQAPWLRWGRGDRAAHLQFTGQREHPVPTMGGAPILSRLDVDHVLIGGPELVDPAIAQVLLAGWDLVVVTPDGMPPGHPIRPWLAHPGVRHVGSMPENLAPSTVLLCCGHARDQKVPDGPHLWYFDAAHSRGEVPVPTGRAVIVRTEGRGLTLTAAGSPLPLGSLPGIGDPAGVCCLHPDGLARQARTALLRQARDAAHGSHAPSSRLSRRQDLAIEDLAQRWSEGRGPQLWADIGHDAGGRLLSLDLNAEGPHCVIAGTTGSGKSEFFRAFLASLALRYSPERVGFVLIDFKGGASFGPVRGFPHVHALLTDLDEATVHRDLSFLQAELTRRERLFKEWGVSSWQESLQRRETMVDPLPELMICVDEFRMLVDSMPDAMKQLLKIATVGRSLGIHLIMSTQRPQGAISPDIRANVAVNICLRVATEADSINVLGSAEAARLPADGAGRGYLHAGGRLRLFTGQFYDGLPRTENPGAVRLRWASETESEQWSAGSTGWARGDDIAVRPARRRMSPPFERDPREDGPLETGSLVDEAPPRPAEDAALLTAWTAPRGRSRTGLPTTRVVPVIPPLVHEQTEDGSAPTDTADMVLGHAEAPRIGWQGEVVWTPGAHGPLEATGPVPEQIRLVDRMAAEATRLDLPCYAVAADPSVATALHRREEGGLDLRGLAVLERPEFCREMLATLLDRARRASRRPAEHPVWNHGPSGGPRGRTEHGLLIIQGADALVDQLSRLDPAVESRVQELVALLGKDWRVCLLGAKPLPRSLRALCSSHLHLGPAARQEFLLARPREGRDLIEGLSVLEGSLAPSTDPAGMWVPETHETPHTAPSRRRAATGWPRLRDLPDVLEWDDAREEDRRAADHVAPHRRRQRTHRALDLPDRWFLTLGVDAPEGKEAGLPLNTGSVAGVVARSAADARAVVAAALAFNPHVAFRVFGPQPVSPATTPTRRTEPTGRLVRGDREGAPVIAIVEDVHRWSASELDAVAAAVSRCDATVLVFDPTRFMASRSPWAEALREAPAALVLGQRSGLEAEFRSDACPATRGPVAPGTGLLLAAGSTRRIRVAVPRSMTAPLPAAPPLGSEHRRLETP